VVAAGRVVFVEETLQVISDEGVVVQRCAVVAAVGRIGNPSCEGPARRAACSPAGRVCWLTHDGGLFFWDLGPGRARAVGWLEGSEQVSAVVPFDGFEALGCQAALARSRLADVTAGFACTTWANPRRESSN